MSALNYLLCSVLLIIVAIALLYAVFKTKGLRLLRIFYVSVAGVTLLALGCYMLIMGIALI